MRRTVTTLAASVLALLLIGLLVFGVLQTGDDSSLDQAVARGERPPAHDAALPLLDGSGSRQLADYRGGWLVVNFFASWCAPCQIEHPILMQLRGRHVRIVGVAYKDAPQNTAAFLSRLGDPFAERLVDRDGRAGIEFGVSGVPETYLVAQDGKVLAKYTNLNEGDAKALTARLLTGR